MRACDVRAFVCRAAENARGEPFEIDRAGIEARTRIGLRYHGTPRFLKKNAMPHAFRPEQADPYQFLEELDSSASVDWVDAQNASTHDAPWLDDAGYRALVDRFTQALLPRERPVIPQRWQDWAYDVWQDEQHPKGLWRRTRWASWRSGRADWQTLIDLDALDEAQGVQWVFDDQLILEPDGDRALIVLSDGGADAVVVREFDIEQGRFVDDGFSIETAGKHSG